MSPRLNVTAWPNRVRYRDNPQTPLAENAISFRVYNNYPSFIQRAEVRVFEQDQATTDEPIAVVAVDDSNMASWSVEFESFTAPVINLKYLLRVYDADGNFDETRALPIWLVDELSEEEIKSFADDTAQLEQLVGYGENHLAVNNIPLAGGTVLVNGSKIPDGHSVWLAGRRIPVSEDGTFVAEEIFCHTCKIEDKPHNQFQQKCEVRACAKEKTPRSLDRGVFAKLGVGARHALFPGH
jgi:hypothetical protein